MKIAVVGGGSTYTPELIDGILSRQGKLPITEIHLVDIDTARVEVIASFAQRMIEAKGSTIKVCYGTDLRKGVRDATFVISQFRVGTQAARNRDELLGREFGLIGQETVGVGGFAKALRTIPVALNLARIVYEESPKAILLNFTNPAGLITEAINRHVPELTTIGLCNVPWNLRTEISTALGASLEDVRLDYVGLNHLSWVRGILIKDQDRTVEGVDAFKDLVIKQGAQPDEPYWNAESLQIVGAIPNYYLLYYYETEKWLHFQETNPTRASEVMKIEAMLLQKFGDTSLVEKPAELMLRGGAYYSDSAAELMADIFTNAGTTHIVNTRNCGAVPGIADDVVMEIPSIITSSGATPISTTAMRADMHALVHSVKDFELLTIDAATTGNEESALRALVTNPLGPDISQAFQVWKRLREENVGMLGLLNV
jgi:6-phospho-beta-glucosidase